MIHNTWVVVNRIGRNKGTAEAPPAAMSAGPKKFVGQVSTGWSTLTAAVNMFGPEATTLDFSKKILKWQANVGVESTKCATFKTQAVKAENLRVFVGMVKGDAELKLFHSMLKYNDLFVATNLSGNVVALMGVCMLEGRTWVFNILR